MLQAGKSKYLRTNLARHEVPTTENLEGMFNCLVSLADEARRLHRSQRAAKAPGSVKAFAVAVESMTEGFLKNPAVSDADVGRIYQAMLPYLQTTRKFRMQAIRSISRRDSISALIQESRSHPSFLRFVRKYLNFVIDFWGNK